ncbi:MAG: pilus assembly protein [Hespellia sp.]|nr:pilus assembly protein [Hespellia sp.]
MRKIKKQKKVQIRGVTTVEMAYIMPVVLLVFLAIIYVTFYFHDKNVLGAVAYETAVIGAQQERLPKGMQEGELSGFFQEHITGKLILLSNPTASVSKNSDYIIVQATASRRNMKLHMEMKTWIMEPEKMIRMIRKVKK